MLLFRLPKFRAAFLASGLLTLTLPAVETPADPPERKAVECTPRSGLPNFFARASENEEIRVAYLGGSITAQPGYRVQTLQHFSKAYPGAKFREINAAIGGTGSDLGVFRLEQDVLREKPDLMFVEFAVNDGSARPTEIIRAMEGIVRKTWKEFPSCDICFVYTFTETLMPDLKEGRLNRSAATMEMVADRYGIPSIHMGLEAVRLEMDGKLLMKADEARMDRVSGEELDQASPIAVGADGKIPFSKDGVHPYPNTGHRLYTGAVLRSLPLLAKAGTRRQPHALAEPIDPDNYQNTAMIPLDRVSKTGPWALLPEDAPLGKAFSKRLGPVWKGEPGAELSFKFKGSAAKIYDLVGPDCGKLDITVDGMSSTRLRFDSYCTYSRLATTPLAGDLDPAAVHEVRIRVLADKIDKHQILFEKNRADFIKSPEKYAPTHWYAGAVFLVGELIP